MLFNLFKCKDNRDVQCLRNKARGYGSNANECFQLWTLGGLERNEITPGLILGVPNVTVSNVTAHPPRHIVLTSRMAV